jgi:ABC-type nitrate/sulfonate/bicarbonate transport system permease component
MKQRACRGLSNVLGNPYLVSVVVAVGIWWLLAGRVIEFLPTPMAVGAAFVEAITDPELYFDMAVTLRRILLAAVGAWTIALILGIAMASSWPLETAGNPLAFIGLALPAPLAIYFCILIFGLGEAATMIAILAIVTPYVVVIMYAGAKSRDKKLVQMATVYRFSRGQQLRDITLPELGPTLMSGARMAFAMGWKLVVIVEALSSNVGIGERLEFFFVFNQPARVIGWTLTFTVVMLFVERYGFAAAEKRLFAWRPKVDQDGRVVQAA